MLLLLVLIVPQSWLFTHNPTTTQHALNIELVQEKAVKQTPQANIIQPPKPPKIISEPVKEQPPIDPAPPKIQQQTLPETKTAQTESSNKQLDASDVQLMMSKAKDFQLNDADFSVRNKQQLFVSQQAQTMDWRGDLPYLDESVDAPRIQMQFYSAGLTGSIERFFDKITIEKTFTTQYGTKIHCALIGVVALCGWK